MYILREGKRLQLEPWRCTLLQQVQSKRISSIHREIWTSRGHKPKLSLDEGLICSISHQLYKVVSTKCSTIPIQLAASMWDRCIYRRRGGGWDPSNGRREALSFGRLPQKEETRSQRKVLDVMQSNNPSWLAHEVVSLETSLLYLKTFQKELGAGSSLRKSANGCGA